MADDLQTTLLARAKQEAPDLDVNVKPANWWDRTAIGIRNSLVGDNAQVPADTSPFTGNITYYPEVMGKLPPELMNSIIAHELVHSRQALTQPWYQRIKDYFTGPDLPYNQDPAEMEAYNEEIARAQRLGLTPPRTPNFSGPGFHDNNDIQLPKR